MGKLTVVVGSQYGSEGKGVVVSKIANDYDFHVRVGGPNAGHTIMSHGKKWKMQMVPCGWVNPQAVVVLGRGILVDVDQLVKEVDEILEVDPTILDRLIIDPKAGILSKKNKNAEGGTSGEIHQRIGSTGEGVGSARVDRVNRVEGEFFHAANVSTQGGNGWKIGDLLREDTPKLLNNAYDQGASILIEGTQGCGLSLVHGPWPMCTSHDTNAAQMLADIGLSPMLVTDIILVVRANPIRVAGNSGPLNNEITFEQLSERLGKEVREYTTVTKKLRRIGEWDQSLFINSVYINRPTQLALMFVDYLSPEDEGKKFSDFSEKTKQFIEKLEKTSKVKVTMACSGWSEEKSNWVITDRNA